MTAATTDVGVGTRVAEAQRRAARLDPGLGVFLRRFDAEAAEAAAHLDEGPAEGLLHGVTLGIKDVIATREAPATCQSRVHDAQWWAGRDATAVARLRAAGAVPLGKTTLAEHALGRPDPALPFPVPRNPWDTDRFTGGSSSGSASGVAAGLFDVGLGTDTNGSIRIPAALCGVTGIKPTHGLVPADGARPLARTLDVVGPLARTVREAAAALAVMADAPAGAPAWRDDLRGVRIGVPRRALTESGQLTDDCGAAFETALTELRALGAETVDFDLPELYPLFAAQFVTLLAEAYELHGAGLRERWGDYGRPFRRTAVLGGLVGAPVYVHAQRVRAWGAENLRARMRGIDAIATPTWPTTAPRYDDAAALQHVSWLPGLWSAVGFPAIALPMGFGGDGLPLSLQLAGAPGTDFALAAVADAYQRSDDRHLRRPPEPDHGATPAAVAVPQGAPGKPETVQWLATSLRELGLSIDESEIVEFAGQWELTSMLFGFLPDLPA
ncbi:aspartyl-tRNA(Asn)/glutamyl-tRNA(Gln) amidotransferase subunit A [Streptomyces olivoverticillatus]|uniref:Aspartyl-tRNA(Asn)/glutamyl-tRNA(Gln) amidotransferase subunit A n=1 Tax=Streptomyces olivoverticillatus TaxID=66427 RepID=A0A7W7PL21_9ACTN|nr:amidase [Streptomyces olivoverticillatus]MBB4892325.1 aspartyl-tRNA(Asn)/glutamyl-tRNA(Gln) amidotransferase subunit A [Streptomyces olivoverticillatus]